MSADSHEPDLDSLINRWRGPILGLLLARGLDRATASDMAEEVFVEAWLGLREGSFHGDPDRASDLGPWLRGIARHLAAAYFRRARSAPRLVGDSSLLDLAGEEVQPADSEVSLREAIEQLPKALREVVLVRYLDQRTGEEAAALLGLTEKAVERRAARARALLRDLLEAKTKGVIR